MSSFGYVALRDQRKGSISCSVVLCRCAGWRESETERGRLALVLDQRERLLDADRADELQLEGRVADEEAELLQAGAVEVAAEPGRLEPPSPASLVVGVAEPEETHVAAGPVQLCEGRVQPARAAEHDELRAARVEVHADAERVRAHGARVGLALDEDGRGGGVRRPTPPWRSPSPSRARSAPGTAPSRPAPSAPRAG